MKNESDCQISWTYIRQNSAINKPVSLLTPTDNIIVDSWTAKQS